MRYVSSSLFRPAMAGAVALGLCASAVAAVTSTVQQYSFVVDGTTASSIVRFMNEHAVDGDHGHAYASIHPDYQMTLTSRQVGGICRPMRLDVNVAFGLTLPVAADIDGMSRGTRSAWTSFASFARVHENHHKQSYLGCAAEFMAQAKRQSAPSCLELENDVRQMLYQMKRSCEARQVPFDQSQARVLSGLSLFSMARAQER